MKRLLLILLFSVAGFASRASTIFIPMDTKQADHLKAYGIAYWILTKGINVDWLLNYRGGSFAFPYTSDFENECTIRGVTYEILPDAQYNSVLAEIANPEVNMDVQKLHK